MYTYGTGVVVEAVGAICISARREIVYKGGVGDGGGRQREGVTLTIRHIHKRKEF